MRYIARLRLPIARCWLPRRNGARPFRLLRPGGEGGNGGKYGYRAGWASSGRATFSVEDVAGGGPGLAIIIGAHNAVGGAFVVSPALTFPTVTDADYMLPASAYTFDGTQTASVNEYGPSPANEPCFASLPKQAHVQPYFEISTGVPEPNGALLAAASLGGFSALRRRPKPVCSHICGLNPRLCGGRALCAD